MVPIKAIETVNPSKLSDRWKICRSVPVVPEITAVSKPKRNEPSAAIMALSTSRRPPCEDLTGIGCS